MSVYALRDPRDGRARYVGRSSRPEARRRAHLARAHSPRLRAWIEELRAVGLEPELALLDGGTEREWIVRLAPDFNIMPGDHDGECFVSFTFLARRTSMEMWKAAARHAGLTLSAWLRMAMREKLEHDRNALVPAEPVDRKKGERR